MAKTGRWKTLSWVFFQWDKTMILVPVRILLFYEAQSRKNVSEGDSPFRLLDSTLLLNS